MTEIPSIVDRLESAGLPADNLLARRAPLPGPVQQLHRRILETIATSGTPPTMQENYRRKREHPPVAIRGNAPASWLSSQPRLLVYDVA